VKAMGDKIQRNVNYDIMKAKGITRKRKKEDKNPRVKKRHQFEKMEKRHKTLVQNFKEGP
jgi:U3 small nucleolar RNA-associated protein 3